MNVTHSRDRARFALATLFAINLLNFFDRNMLGALVEPIRKEWALTDSQIGWLATAFTLLYAVVGIPLGRLSDRWQRPKILGLGVAVWSLLTAASGTASSYGALFAARLGVGIGEASCAPASSSLIGDLFPAKHRARAFSVFMLGLPLGTFLGTFVSGRLAAAYGWRVPFYVAGAPGLLLAILAWRIYEPPRGWSESSPGAGRLHQGSAYWCVLKIPTMRWLIISGALMNFNMYAIGTFLPAFLSRYHALDLKEANAITAIVFGLVGVPGLLLGGWVADYAGRHQLNGRLLVTSISSLIAAPCIYLALGRPSGQIATFSLLMGTGCMLAFVYYAAVYAAIQDVVPPTLRSTAMAIYFLAMYLLGGSFGPVLTGRLSDHFARLAMSTAGATHITESFRAAGLHSAMYVIPLGNLILSAVLLAAARAVSKDMNELQLWIAQPQRHPQAANS
ncbi:MAG TPA: MFS transporter [Candidatus Dormibacteraeota bacterium]|nr:MFS transporter [Candidatus Dormibacteraeota bacterium]